MLIFITGFMGVGKSTIGKAISEKLNYPFIDLDEVIEKDQGLSIASIFEKHGEDHFRLLEEKMLQQIIKKSKKAIFSLGGGTILNKHISSLILSHGICIYLEKSWENIEIDLHTLHKRPLIQQKTQQQLKALFHEREPFYSRSQLKVPINVTFDVQKLTNYLKLLTNR